MPFRCAVFGYDYHINCCHLLGFALFVEADFIKEAVQALMMATATRTLHGQTLLIPSTTIIAGIIWMAGIFMITLAIRTSVCLIRCAVSGF